MYTVTLYDLALEHTTLILNLDPDIPKTYLTPKMKVLGQGFQKLTFTSPIPLRLYTLPHWSNPPGLDQYGKVSYIPIFIKKRNIAHIFSSDILITER